MVPTQLCSAERYTCYDLGESLLVGGGDPGSGAADGGQSDMERVMPLHCTPPCNDFTIASASCAACCIEVSVMLRCGKQAANLQALYCANRTSSTLLVMPMCMCRLRRQLQAPQQACHYLKKLETKMRRGRYQPLEAGWSFGRRASWLPVRAVPQQQKPPAAQMMAVWQSHWKRRMRQQRRIAWATQNRCQSHPHCLHKLMSIFAIAVT